MFILCTANWDSSRISRTFEVCIRGILEDMDIQHLVAGNIIAPLAIVRRTSTDFWSRGLLAHCTCTPSMVYCRITNRTLSGILPEQRCDDVRGRSGLTRKPLCSHLSGDDPKASKSEGPLAG